MSAEDFELGNDDFKKGWARRLKVDGGIYGRTYIEDYKDDIEEYFIRGKINSSEKMNAAQNKIDNEINDLAQYWLGNYYLFQWFLLINNNKFDNFLSKGTHIAALVIY